MKHIYYASLWLILCLFAVACNDENEIYFTQDEIVQGDINTGKQIKLEGNTLIVYTEGGGYVNVQGAKGEIQATSDENIATVKVAQEGKNTVLVTAVSIGKTYVTVTDAEGSSSGFTVEVKDEEELWTQKRVFSFTSGNQCVVEGVSPTDSATIATEVLSQTIEEATLVFKGRSFIPNGTYQRLYAYNQSKQLLYKGLYTLDSIDERFLRLNVYDKEELLTSFLVDKKTHYYLVKDLTDEYKARPQYAAATKVWLYLKYTLLS
ncbi:pilus assembly protein N-terminal domain-containing protein [Parabacteroides johnsonii]|uniref:pilus assembly protein N-terminal domain-containing protein n=1 Tax=Parabacteroides johnsonii TaxID=387661 RepID=UPI00189A961D|nr:pilus assembly protein N-terminal domain-containing protein [Parabacteroides johnsonii]